MNHKRHRWFFFLAILMAILACNYPSPTSTQLPPTPFFTTPLSPTPLSPIPPSPTPLSPSPSPTVTFQPTFEPASCDFPVPRGYNPECGYLVVPENRNRPEGLVIRLHVAVFRSKSANPAPDPVVHLAGGPGSSSLDVAGYMFRHGLDAILEQRDFILFDQRGTGYSQPRLDCPEREELAPILLEGHFPPGESTQAILDAFRRCRDRLIAGGVDLTAYNSAASAADINDLRVALEYAQLNLYGVSYGTRLALTVMRDFPAAVRSAVLDSTYPPQVNLYTSLAPNAQRAFNILFDHCASDPACNGAYPDLRSVFYELVDRLNANPVPVTLIAGEAERAVLLTGDLLVDVLFVGLYNPFVTSSMPKMIFDIRQGDYSILRERLGLYFDASGALGMQMSVQCAEEIPFSLPEEAYTAAQEVQPQIAGFFPESVQPLFAICQEWGLAAPDPRENQAVTSDLPALILAGEYDPITPPDWGRMAASSLPHAYFYEFPGNGHWVTRSTNCALAMALAFWEDPIPAPDSSCIQSLDGLDFARSYE